MSEEIALGQLEQGAADAALAWLVDVARWDSVRKDTRERTAELIARAGDRLRFVEVRECKHPTDTEPVAHQVAFFEREENPVAKKLALIPGGEVVIGLAEPIRPALRRVMPPDSFAFFEKEGALAQFERDQEAGVCFAPARRLVLQPFLIEVEAIPFLHIQEALESPDEEEESDRDETDYLRLSCEGGWRLPTPEEQEHVYRAGTNTVFPWGEAWPGSDHCPVNVSSWVNAFGARYRSEWEMECTSRYGVLRGFDHAGWGHGGFDYRIVWMSSYTTHPGVIEGSEWEHYQGAAVRRVLPIVSEPPPESIGPATPRRERWDARGW